MKGITEVHKALKELQGHKYGRKEEKRKKIVKLISGKRECKLNGLQINVRGNRDKKIMVKISNQYTSN